MAATLPGVFNVQQFTDTGAPASGYRLYTYAPSTTTHKAAYTDQAATTPHTYTSDGVGGQYIALNSRGELAAPLWLAAGGYDLTLKSPLGATVWTRRAFGTGDTSSGALTDLADTTSAAKGAGLVGFGEPLAYGAGTVGAKLNTVVADIAKIGASATTGDGIGAVGYNSALAYPDNTIGGGIRSEYALRKGRTAPHANFSWFTSDFTVTQCPGVGLARVQQDIRDVWNTKYAASMTGGTKYVAPASKGGNDANSGDTWAAPYLTIDKAIRTSNSGLVHVWPGDYETTGFRYTDTQGDRPKMIVAPFGGVTLKVAGDTISAATFAANGTFGQVYETTLSTSNWVIRVLHSSTTDPLGLPVPMPKQSSIATVDSSTFGWWYDSATKKFYVRSGTENVNTTTKANLTAVYAPGGDNSLLVNSTKLYLENITLWYYPSVLKTLGQAVPEVWMKNCTVRYAESSSRLVQGGGCYSQGCTFYRSTADHGNYNIAASTTAYAVEIDDRTYYAGDVDTFGSGATQPNNPISTAQNKNSSSNHDSYLVRINGVHEGSYGPVIADTDGSYTWNLGVRTGYSYATGSLKYGWIVQGSTARAWLDGCVAGPGTSGINSDTSAVVNTFNTAGAQVTSASGTFADYLPGTA